MPTVIESTYPLSFRKEDARRLGVYLRHHESVVLVGMKRVGISNFLRFFLSHEEVPAEYIKNSLPQLFISVDMNDLVERNLFAFWILLLKRLADTIEESGLSSDAKRLSQRYFQESIQLHDQFYTYDSVRKVLRLIVDGDFYPVIFLVRFDRIADVVSKDFFNNLQGIKDSVERKISWVFTSYRTLDKLKPEVFDASSLSVFAKAQFIKPAQAEDLSVILATISKRYGLQLSPLVRKHLLVASGGHVQYAHLALIRLREEKFLPQSEGALFKILSEDEQIRLLNQELYESLNQEEQQVVTKLIEQKSIEPSEFEQTQYLWDTGMVAGSIQVVRFFNPLFEEFIRNNQHSKSGEVDFSKKEKRLFEYLNSHLGELCEREDIVETVWPESKEYGVTDWAIDQLVARVRKKLRKQESELQIITVVTRGYRMIRKD
jgi:hypothetical protein